jgi:phosphoserine aminotransferase
MRDELLDYRGRGLSVLEMSHRSRDFVEIADSAERNLRQLLTIPDTHQVLFMQGGATAQFALCVQNLDAQGSVAYVNSGYWSRKAMASASPMTRVREVAHCVSDPLQRIPPSATWESCADTSFVHITDNETIDGIVFDSVPDAQVPLVADMSSSILSQPVDIARYGLIYAGAQKNIGPAGITLLIIANELLERSAAQSLPDVFSYAAIARAGSMLNTPPTFAWYAAGLVFEWLLEQGGLTAMAEQNQRQAARVYAVLDRYELYLNRIHPANRSRMNIPFQLSDESLTGEFLEGASQRGFVGLKGHKSVGGLRASLYNAVTDAAVDALVDFLNEFAEAHA